jgi:tetratricopeptide (TPR) repeat protein
MNNLGLLAMEEGAYSRAEGHFTDALNLCADQSELIARRPTLVNLGHLNRERGKYAEAADYFRQALESARDEKDPDEEYLLQFNLGRLAEDWGRLKKAGEFFTQSLSIARNAGAARREVLSLTALSQVAAKEGQLDKALQDLLQAGELCARAGLPTEETDLQLGQLYLDAGKPYKAAQYLEKSGSHAALGRLGLAKEDYKKAETHYSALLETATKSGAAADLFTAHTGLGRTFEAQKEYEKAGKHYTQAMELTEELRGGLIPSQRRNFLSIRVNGFDRAEPAKGLNRLSFKQGRPIEGVVPAELARARAFADRLAVGPEQGYSGVPESVQERERELSARIAALNKDRSCCGRSLNPERYDNLTKKIEAAEAEQKGLIDMLWADFAPYAAVKYPRPLSPDDWAVKPDEWVVVFDVLDEGVGTRLFKGKNLWIRGMRNGAPRTSPRRRPRFVGRSIRWNLRTSTRDWAKPSTRDSSLPSSQRFLKGLTW